MKRTIFLVMIMISMISSAFPQNPECIYCGSNELIETSSAIGNLNQNLGEFSLTIGNNNKIAQKLQFVTLIGYNNIVNGNLIGNYSGAFGINNLIQSDKSYIIGNEDTVSATGAISIGTGSRVSGLYSISIGLNTKAYGNYSVAIGNRAIAKAMNSYSFGNNVWSDAYGSITIGTSPIFLKNTTPNSLVIGFNSSVPTLFVGVSDGSGTTGKIGIGNVTDPQTKLHIKADSNEDAAFMLEPTGAGKIAKIILGTNEYYLSASAGNNLVFRTPSGKNFSFENGKIIASSLLISTGFGSGKLLQSDASGNAFWTDPAWTISSGNLYRISGNVGIGYSSTTTLNNRLEVNGYANTTSGYKVGNSLVINSSRDYSGRNGILSGALTVAGTSALNGNVGIGISTPQKKLDVNGDINFTGSLFQNNVPVNFSGYWASNGNNIYYNNGNVGIGISNPSPDYKLSVAGKILAEELQIQLVQDWYDNVFEEDYSLMDLNELESFVKQNNHLPDIPSEAEVKENGIRVGEMNALLLKKVEELTLYIIEQQKMLECQHNEIENLKHLFTSKNNQ